MRKNKSFFRAFLTCLALPVVLIACQKESEKLSSEDLQQAKISSESEAMAEAFFGELFDNVMGVNEELGMGTGIGVFGRPANSELNDFPVLGRPDTAHHCFTVTISPNTPGVFPKTVTIDFGNGCVGPDGRTRKGQIITVYSGRMIYPGSQATTTFHNYFVDSIQVEGTHILTNTSTNNHQSFNVKVQQGKISFPNGFYLNWNKNKNWTKIQGNGTPNYPQDDVFSITGVSHGTVYRGPVTVQWSTEILQPLIRKFACRWIVQGEKKITRNAVTGIINYGSGNCDNQAVLSINGNTINITLH